jgi:hypothetical protein
MFYNHTLSFTFHAQHFSFTVVTNSTALPERFSGKSIVNSSIGSHFLPSISLIITCG